MRRHLIDRMLRRIVTGSAPLSNEQRRDLRRAFAQRSMDSGEMANVVRAASRGRVGEVDALTEVEAMALLLRLEPRSVNAQTAGQPGL